MEYKDDFRERMIALDEIGFIGVPNARKSKKEDCIVDALIKASKKMWKEQGRNLTDEEKNEIIQDALKAYNRELRQRRKLLSFDKTAAVTL